MITLNSSPACGVLDRLYAAEQDNEAVFTKAKQSTIGRDIAAMSSEELAEVFADVYMPVARPVGDFLYLLARAQRASLIVEFGTSFGLSTIFLAAAARDNGGGTVVTTELHPRKAAAAQANLAEAGLGDLVEVRCGDALETLADLPGEVDLVLLDGWKHLNLPVLRLVEPRLRAGALVLADDLRIMPAVHRPYLAYVRSPANGYHSVEVPMGDGMELSIRLR
jgi:predicted O-methyltransferase YrrM